MLVIPSPNRGSERSLAVPISFDLGPAPGFGGLRSSPACLDYIFIGWFGTCAERHVAGV
jgi:hypothetical protein